jgi:hypothetical protein
MSSLTFKELFSCPDYCFAQLSEVRERISSPELTQSDLRQVKKFLGIMYLSCPKSLQSSVRAVIEEATLKDILINY